MTERQLLESVRELAGLLGWLDYHTWQSIHSPAGFPDLVLVRPPRIVFAELKSEHGRVSPAQQQWLEVLRQCPGAEVYVWRPGDWRSGAIERALK